MKSRARIKNKSRDKRVFSSTAQRVNGKNMLSTPMRGGYRF